MHFGTAHQSYTFGHIVTVQLLQILDCLLPLSAEICILCNFPELQLLYTTSSILFSALTIAKKSRNNT